MVVPSNYDAVRYEMERECENGEGGKGNPRLAIPPDVCEVLKSCVFPLWEELYSNKTKLTETIESLDNEL